MFKTGLQLFAEAVSGKKIVYLYRLAEKRNRKQQRILRLQRRMEEPRVRMQILLQRKTVQSVHQELRRQKLQPLLFWQKAIN